MQTATDDFGAEFAPDDDPFRTVPQVPPQPQMPAILETWRIMRGPSRYGHYYLKLLVPGMGRNGTPTVYQEVRKAALDCGCMPKSVDDIARCVGCRRLICRQCRSRCASCGGGYCTFCLIPGKVEGPRPCRTCYEHER